MASNEGDVHQLQENWSNIISRKEDEINKLREKHVSELEERLFTKESEVGDLRQDLSKLRDDLKYNLEVLEERDRDLREYDEVLSRELKKSQDRSRVIDETRGVVEKLQLELQAERQKRDEEKNYYKQKVFELREEAENAKYGKEEAILRQKEAFEKIRRGLEKEVEELNGEKDLQSHQLTNLFNEKVQRLESELRLQKQEATHRVKQLEEKLEKRESDLEKVTKSEREKGASLSRAQEASAEHERSAKALSFEFEEWKVTKENVIAELEGKLQSVTRSHQVYVNNAKTAENKLSLELLDLQNVAEKLQETYQKRLKDEYSGLVSERDTFKVRTEAAEERLKALESELQSLQSAHKIEERDAREKIAKLEAERNEALQNLSSSTQDITRKYHTEMRMLKEELWSKNEEVSVLRTKETNMKSSLDSRRGDINSYKEQLASSIERERELKRTVRALQLKAELDLQTSEAKISASNENVVKQLTEEKDYSSEKMRQYEEKIIEQEDQIAALRKEIDTSKQPQPQPQLQSQLATSIPENWSPDSSLLGLNLNLSDVSPTMSLNTPAKPGAIATKIKEMESENARLKDVIGALRQEMESVEAPAVDESKLKALELELAASDADYQQAMNHVRILQSRDAADSSSGGNRAELDFLRGQSARILLENRNMRRLGIHAGAASAAISARDDASLKAASTLDQISDTYTQERLLIYSKLVDMRNLLTPKKRENPTSMGDNNMIIALADKVAELVQRACKRLEIKASNLRRVTDERDRVLALNNALRSTIDKKKRSENESELSAKDDAAIPSLPEFNSNTAEERILTETNEKLSYVQSSLVDLKQQSEELMRYQRETQKLISQTDESQNAPSSSSSFRPQSSAGKQQQISGNKSTSAERKTQVGEKITPPKQAKKASTSFKGLKLTGSSQTLSSQTQKPALRTAASSQGTTSQRAKLQALALRKQRREKELSKPKIRNYNIKDDKAVTEQISSGSTSGGGNDATNEGRG